MSHFFVTYVAYSKLRVALWVKKEEKKPGHPDWKYQLSTELKNVRGGRLLFLKPDVLTLINNY